jgi:hypothetical protein
MLLRSFNFIRKSKYRNVMQIKIVGPTFLISKTNLAVKKPSVVGIFPYVCDDTALVVHNKMALYSDGHISVT